MRELLAKHRRCLWMGATVLGTTVVILLAASLPATALAAIAFVRNLGTAAGAGVPALNIVTTGPVTAGNSIVVSIAYNNGGTNSPLPVACSDTAGNTYTTSIQAAREEVITAICFAHNVTALPMGSTITVSFGANATNADVSASEFSGLLASGTLDRQASDTGASTAPATTASGVTAQPDELLVGAIGTGAVGLTFTPGTNGTANACATTGTPTYTALPPRADPPIVSIFPEFCIVSAAAS